MRVVPAVLTLAFPALAHAAGDDPPATPPASDGPAAVIGGSNAMAGKWPDVAAILFPTGGGDQPRCSGTLVAPTVVLTAGHCYNFLDPPLPDNVLIGTSSLARPGDGETIAIKRGFAFPDAETSEDVAVLVLSRPSSFAPRKLATGWARIDIVNGATVSLVGFGAINKLGDKFVNELQEASSTITDFDCSQSSGCNAAAQPAGELGAGGMGIDTCPGDSGGPLYLITSYGALLAGVTSRSYDDATFACSEGGIYGRPDKIIDWLETTAGVPVTRGPEPDADPIVAVRGDGGDTRIHVNDPASNAHSFAITTPPAHGMAKVRSDGAVRVCVNSDAAPGDDELTVTITDTKHAGRALPITIKVRIDDGTPGPPCDLDAFDSGGCCDSRGHSDGALPLAIGVLALVIRRRRCATLKLWPRPG
ncbi:MAG TPA: trypsin-like serine protease [Kofleriaceae bacterium]|nr:trypsin-like serine protease [Kofleriaceae bacterium]